MPLGQNLCKKCGIIKYHYSCDLICDDCYDKGLCINDGCQIKVKWIDTIDPYGQFSKSIRADFCEYCKRCEYDLTSTITFNYILSDTDAPNVNPLSDD
jgi:hypothetical protein